MKCRFCNNNLGFVFIDLYNSPPSNSFLTKEQLSDEEKYFPLKIFVCENCFLVQAGEYKKANEIFDKDYIYFSSYSKSWLKHCEDYAEKIISRFGINNESLVMEIASNDGYLLQFFNNKNIPVLGIEPTAGTAKVAVTKGINTIVEFFSESFAKRLITQNSKADLLIGNNVLAHVPDINDFVKGLKIALKQDGVITMEFPHLQKLVEENQFDTIYHEHFSYLSLTTVDNIFDVHGLSIFDVDELPTHGGSLRIYAQHKENNNLRPGENNVQNLKEKEAAAGMKEINYYKGFQEKANKIKYDLLEFLIAQKKKGKKIAAYGAAAKGNTMLNYSGIRSDLINFVVDASPYKQNKFLPGSHIPVMSEAELKEFRPDFILILPWNIRDEIIDQLHYAKEWKARFVTAIPELKIIQS
ncbi:MAG: class I SAM-dependent methyltransferase [bacterium]